MLLFPQLAQKFFLANQWVSSAFGPFVWKAGRENGRIVSGSGMPSLTLK
jgi:hypothetical protein